MCRRFYLRGRSSIYFFSLVSWYLLFSCRTFAGSLSVEGRYELQNTARDLTTISTFYNSNPLGGIYFQTGLRLSASLKDLETLGYEAMASVPWFSFLETSLRLSEESWLNSTTEQTHLLFLTTLKAKPIRQWELFFSGGWYRRYVRLTKTYLLPALIGPSYTEHDFAVALGTKILFSSKLSTLFKVATFEELSVYNLNNPFLQGEVSYQPVAQDWELSLLFRYRLLLGFGRMDSLTTGVSYRKALP